MRKGMAASVRPLVHATSCRAGVRWVCGWVKLPTLPYHCHDSFAHAPCPGSLRSALLLQSSQGRAATATHQRDIGLDEVVAGVEAGGEALALPLIHKVAQQVLGDVAVARLWR